MGDYENDFEIEENVNGSANIVVYISNIKLAFANK